MWSPFALTLVVYIICVSFFCVLSFSDKFLEIFFSLGIGVAFVYDLALGGKWLWFKISGLLLVY